MNPKSYHDDMIFFNPHLLADSYRSSAYDIFGAYIFKHWKKKKKPVKPTPMQPIKETLRQRNKNNMLIFPLRHTQHVKRQLET